VRTQEQLVVPKINNLVERVGKLEEAAREMEAPDLSGLAASSELAALITRFNKAEVELAAAVKALKTKTAPVPCPTKGGQASKDDVEAVKKENNALRAGFVTLVARMGVVEGTARKNSSRIDAVEEAKNNKRPAGVPLDSHAKYPRYDADNSGSSCLRDDVDSGSSYPRVDAAQGLPPGWHVMIDHESGDNYYYNQYTAVSQRARPFVALPSHRGMMPPPPRMVAPNININNSNNTNFAPGFSPETAAIYAAFERSEITPEQLGTLKSARTMTKGFKK
jgi:hypothetical protein